MRKKYKPTKKMLGEGEFGQVFLFEGRGNDKNTYAVKIMRKSLLGSER